MKHEAVKGKAQKGNKYFFVRCGCGWISRERFTPELAIAEFEDHVTAKSPKKKTGVMICEIS